MTFSLVGVDASIANAFRRILIAEVPTLAIEDVYITQNSSIVQDEILAQRLGLIPLKGNPAGISFLRWFKKPSEEEEQGSMLTDYNTVVMELKVKCDWKPGMKKEYMRAPSTKLWNPKDLYDHSEVYAKDLTFAPAGRQTQFFSGDGAIGPVNPDILIAKLRPEQEIELVMHCIKGIGADHAKFSPVATASYRLLPDIRILKPIIGADAEKFKQCFPPGVIGLRAITKEEARKAESGCAGKAGEMKAVVVDAMRDTVSRECLRHDEFKDKVKLGRVRDHFIFQVESTGQFESEELFLESVRLLKSKCQKMKRALDVLMGGT